MVQQEDIGPANRGSGCNSRWVHFDGRWRMADRRWTRRATLHRPSAIDHRPCDPVVQRRRLLAYTQTTMVRVHPGSFGFWIFDFRVWIQAGGSKRSILPSNRKAKIENLKVLAEQPGVLATLSRWRSGVQIPSGTPSTARYAIRQSGEAQTFVQCGFDSHPRH